MIKHLLRIILLFGVLLASALFSFLATIESLRVVQRTDYTQEATVGIISIRGWPWTFESSAPGYAWAQDFDKLGFFADLFVYFLIGFILIISIGFICRISWQRLHNRQFHLGTNT